MLPAVHQRHKRLDIVSTTMVYRSLVVHNYLAACTKLQKNFTTFVYNGPNDVMWLYNQLSDIYSGSLGNGTN